MEDMNRKGIQELFKMLIKKKEYKIVKINFSSELKQKMIETYGKVYMENNNEYDVVTTTNKVLEEVKKVVKNKIRILKSN